LSYRRGSPPTGGPSLDRAFEAVAPAVKAAALAASERLREMGVRHALVGGLAVGAHGAPRNTTDVDFLVGREAFESSGPLLVHRQGVPVRVGSIAIDLLPAEEPVFERALDEVQGSGAAVPIVSLAVIVHMKLRALRPHDQDDVRRLIAAGADLGAIRDHLADAEPPLLSRLDWVLRTPG
jgi:hypothetical protein